MSRLFDLPSRGGRLAILNAAFWFLVALHLLPLPMSGTGQLLITLPCLIVFSLPLTPCLVPDSHGFHRRDEIVLFGLLLGLNAFLWGYGLSWLITHLSHLRRLGLRTYFFPDLTPIDYRSPPPPPPPPTCPTCGYDTRATPTRCPECGTTLPPPGPTPR